MSVQTITDNEFKSTLEQHERVAVKYFANWCGSCKLFSPKYKRLSNDPRFEGIEFIEVNAEENEIARRAAGVDNLPYFAVFKNGELVSGVSSSKEEIVVDLLNKLN